MNLSQPIADEIAMYATNRIKVNVLFCEEEGLRIPQISDKRGIFGKPLIQIIIDRYPYINNLWCIGVNLRVTGHCNQGDRKYMEDAFAVAYQQTNDENDLEYAYFGVFDGHGGRDAAIFAKEHLMNAIVSQKLFWSDNDENVLKAIKEGFVATHMAMWKEVGKWPQTISGLPSTSGTTASVIFIRNGKLYVGHVGDSAVVLGSDNPGVRRLSARSLTSDHKPELPAERKRIEDGGGSVMSKCGVQRVVWNRPRIGHKGPIRRSTHIDQIPFLAVARSLGDLWSYDYFHSRFIVSPEPDVSVVPINYKYDRCIIIATDGVWNMISSSDAVRYVQAAEKANEQHFLANDSIPIGSQPLINPSQLLVDKALSLWYMRNKRADNATVLTIMIDPPGPPKSEVLLRRRFYLKLTPQEISEDIPAPPTYTELLNNDLTNDESLEENPLPHASHSQILYTTAKESSCGKPKSDKDLRPVISSEYDIWTKGSLCLQRNGGCRLVPDMSSNDHKTSEEMWRLAPTPPLPDDQDEMEDVTCKPRYRLIRTQSTWIKPIKSNDKCNQPDSTTTSSAVCQNQVSSSTESSCKSPSTIPTGKTRDSDYNERMINLHNIISQDTNNETPAKQPSTVKPSVSRPNSVKRRSVPGKRELVYLLAKQSRFARNHFSPNSIYKGACTRSKVRIRNSKF
ncbi:hypothetical protein CHUAL_004507 [Chamberlinius hualienensis]